MSPSDPSRTRADRPRVVVDTNVFVAAGFRRSSASAELVERIRKGDAVLVWNESTRSEAERVLRRIPPLDWAAVRDLFSDEGRFDGTTDPDAFGAVPDPTDRKFAALAAAAGVPLVTADDDLLGVRHEIDAIVCSAHEFARINDAM